jgi:hypothetical protein
MTQKTTPPSGKKEGFQKDAYILDDHGALMEERFFVREWTSQSPRRIRAAIPMLTSAIRTATAQ